MCVFIGLMCVISFTLNKCLFVVSCTSLRPCHKISAPVTFFECRRSVKLRQGPFGLHFMCIVFLLSNFLQKYCHFFSLCIFLLSFFQIPVTRILALQTEIQDVNKHPKKRERQPSIWRGWLLDHSENYWADKSNRYSFVIKLATKNRFPLTSTDWNHQFLASKPRTSMEY
jgi:hypothetical protein